MVRNSCLWIPVFFLSCKSLPDSRASMGSSLLATGPKATRLVTTADNTRLTRALALVDSEQSCSGVLIGKASVPDSPAYLLTAGHCLMDLDDIRSSQYIFRDALPRSDRNSLRFSQGEFRIGRVVYATMKGVDLALAEITDEDEANSIYRLTERMELEGDEARAPRALTIGQLKKLGIEPLHWAQSLPAPGDEIRIISAAASEAKPFEQWREHRCQHEGLFDVVESVWHWRNLARNNCADILAGTSGAPVLDQDAAIFALVNTSSRNALSQDCYLGQPCEVLEQSFHVAAARNYGSTLLHLPACFDAHGIFAPDEPRCSLERTASAVVLSQIPTPLNPKTAKASERRWNVSLKPSDPRSAGFHFKSVRLPGFSCEQAKGYSERLPWSDTRLRELPVPVSAGLYALCVVSEEQFQKNELRSAAMILLNVDEEPPQLKPRLVSHPQTQEPLMAVRKSCRNLPNAAPYAQRLRCAVAVLSFELQPYEIVDFYQGLLPGTAQAQDCRSVKQESRGAQLTIPVSELPAKICVWAVDGAGNRSEEPVVIPIRAATRREIIEATDIMADWSFRPNPVLDGSLHSCLYVDCPHFL